MKDKYRVNEIFYSIQGEGIRQGTANVFVRFSGCNLKCSKDDELSGFDCDSEFSSGVDYTLDELVHAVYQFWPLHSAAPLSVIFTGGESAMQLDQRLIDPMKELGWYLCIETNGTYELPTGLDWVCCSPKSAEHTLRVKHVDELKYVRHIGQGLPKPKLKAKHYLISPAFEPDWTVKPETIAHCIQMVKDNPTWRLSVQMHKFFGVR